MKKSLIVVLVIAVILIGSIGRGVKMYNGFITLEEGVDAQWAQVENVYQRRLDLIPNLVNTVKGYAAHESETLTAVVEARAKATQTNVNGANMAQFQENQAALTSALSKLMVVVEKYPDLKANENFLDLQNELSDTENKIEMARRFYNGAVRELNTKVQSIPSNIIASLFSFKTRDYFEIAMSDATKPVLDFDV